MFICPGWIFTSPVVLLMCNQFSPVLCIVYAGNDVGYFMGGRIVDTCLAMISWTFSRLDLLLYLCTSGMLHVLPLYGPVVLVLTLCHLG